MIKDIIGIVLLLLAFFLAYDTWSYWRLMRLIMGKKTITYRDLINALIPAMLCVIGALLVSLQ
jgi:hypothetical protein